MNEIQQKIFDTAVHERNEARKECERLRQELEAERQQRQFADDTLRGLWEQQQEYPAESELERRAWELYVSSVASGIDMSPELSFIEAGEWVYYREQRRKAGGT